MRLTCYILLLAMLAAACSTDRPGSTIPEIPAVLDTLTDEYNGRLVPKVRKIFRKGIEYTYRAVYTDTSGAIISDNTVTIRPSGERWEYQPERQDVVEIFFNTTPEEKARVLANPINKTYPLEAYWTDFATEGIIENAEKVWIHPIRHNQYIFTEVAPFPEIKLPPEEGEKWSATISGLGGWGDWDGASIFSGYTNKGKEKVKLPIGTFECWAIEARATFDYGTSTAMFHFHEDLGFVKMSYRNYLGQGLVFVMQSVREL
ncbi:MAG: hypothetical protein R3301_06625 [Saprospiraceae bacterium]|nr:hypothetical protein [Saprospiraceae bacterium]